jgi:molybdopterin biosynthesis enzyme
MSVLVCFHRYVLPALAAMSGVSWERRTLALAAPVEFTPPLAFFLPVAVTGDHLADPVPTANSGDFATAIASHGFIELPPEPVSFPPGTAAPYQPWL